MKKEEFIIHYSNKYKEYYIIVGKNEKNNIRKYIRTFDKPKKLKDIE